MANVLRAVSRDLESALAVLVVVPGLTSVVLSATLTLNTRGMTALRPAEVSCDYVGLISRSLISNFLCLSVLRVFIVGTAPPPVPANPAVSTSTCPKCGTTKLGKLSCCAADGAWVHHCGDDGDGSKFDHTWKEGVLACEGAAILRSNEAQLQLQIRPRYQTTQTDSNFVHNGSLLSYEPLFQTMRSVGTTQGNSNFARYGVSQLGIVSNGWCVRLSRIISVISLLVWIAI